MELSVENGCKKWAAEYVLGMGLCPFAKGPLEKGEIEWKMVTNLGGVDAEIEHFIKSPMSSVFFILPQAEDFSFFLELLDAVEELVRALGYSEDLQTVSFHPRHQYDGTSYTDVENYANRAPAPMIQLLRKADLESLGVTSARKEEIMTNNSKTLAAVGVRKLKAMLDEYAG